MGLIDSSPTKGVNSRSRPYRCHLMPLNLPLSYFHAPLTFHPSDPSVNIRVVSAIECTCNSLLNGLIPFLLTPSRTARRRFIVLIFEITTK